MYASQELLAADGTLGHPPVLKPLDTQYIFQYSEHLKYAHMATLAAHERLVVAAWQVSPGAKEDPNATNMAVEGLPDQRILYAGARTRSASARPSAALCCRYMSLLGLCITSAIRLPLPCGASRATTAHTARFRRSALGAP